TASWILSVKPAMSVKKKLKSALLARTFTFDDSLLLKIFCILIHCHSRESGNPLAMLKNI
ncbi:MAG: hypothetical protein P8O73_08920, partial [SAR324 cluster bacterium]|nr:hypothetical protein [SAR324 cluster bacterium]